MQSRNGNLTARDTGSRLQVYPLETLALSPAFTGRATAHCCDGHATIACVSLIVRFHTHRLYLSVTNLGQLMFPLGPFPYIHWTLCYPVQLLRHRPYLRFFLHQFEVTFYRVIQACQVFRVIPALLNSLSHVLSVPTAPRKAVLEKLSFFKRAIIRACFLGICFMFHSPRLSTRRAA